MPCATSHWKLRDEDARGLIGGISNGAFYQLKRGASKSSEAKILAAKALDQDKLTRISRPLGIFKALNILYSTKLADAWVQLPNFEFHFRRPDAAGLHVEGRGACHAAGSPTAGRAPRRAVIEPRECSPKPRPFPRTIIHCLLPNRFYEEGESVLSRLGLPPRTGGIYFSSTTPPTSGSPAKLQLAPRNHRARIGFRGAPLSHH